MIGRAIKWILTFNTNSRAPKRKAGIGLFLHRVITCCQTHIRTATSIKPHLEITLKTILNACILLEMSKKGLQGYNELPITFYSGVSIPSQLIILCTSKRNRISETCLRRSNPLDSFLVLKLYSCK